MFARLIFCFFFCKQKTAYEMRISDWSSDVCPSDLLRSEAGGDRRLDQILTWLGDEFDGLLLFDEAHAMGGVAGGEGRFGATSGSQQGIAGVELQNRLPRARVIYDSATGASDVNNLAYATRLGL